jgi:hypothetical protein
MVVVLSEMVLWDRMAACVSCKFFIFLFNTILSTQCGEKKRLFRKQTKVMEHRKSPMRSSTDEVLGTYPFVRQNLTKSSTLLLILGGLLSANPWARSSSTTSQLGSAASWSHTTYVLTHGTE